MPDSNEIHYERYLDRKDQDMDSRELGSLQAELMLLRSAPGASLNGVANRLQTYYEDPSALMTPVAAGFGIGVLLSAVATRAKVVPAYGTIAKYLGSYAIATTATDAAIRIGVPMVNTWNDPSSVHRQSDLLGNNVGSMLVDYSIMGASGFAGGRAYMRGTGMLPGAPSTLRDSEELARSIGKNFERPRTYEPFVERNEVHHRFGWKESDPGLVMPQHELPRAAASIERGANEWAQGKGLPAIKAEHNPELTTLAAANPFNGRMQFNGTILSTGNKLDVINCSAHELTHMDQGVTFVRYFADHIGIKTKATPEQATRLRELVEMRCQIKPSDDYLAAVLEMRNGQRLSDGQKGRAQRLLADQDNLAYAYEKLYGALNQVQSIEHFQNLAKLPDGAQTFKGLLNQPGKDWEGAIKGLNVSPEVKAWMNRPSEPLPVHDARTGHAVTAADSPAWSADKKMLSAWLDTEHERALARFYRVRYGDYQNVAIEQEAFRAGNAAAWNYFSLNPRNALMLGVAEASTADGLQWLGSNAMDRLNKK